MRKWEIYALCDPRTNIPHYIGVTLRDGRQRYQEHLYHAKKDTGKIRHVYAWIRSLLQINIKPIYLILQIGYGKGWQIAERYWINFYKVNGYKLTNLTDGGDGTPGQIRDGQWRINQSIARKGKLYPPGRQGAMLGKHHTDEAKKKISLAGIGRKQTPEQIRKIAEAKIGKPLSIAHKLKISQAHKGKSLTEEHKWKIASTTTNRKPVQCIETGAIFQSITQTARTLMVSETSVNQSIRKDVCCRGNHYKFI